MPESSETTDSVNRVMTATVGNTAILVHFHFWHFLTPFDISFCEFVRICIRPLATKVANFLSSIDPLKNHIFATNNASPTSAYNLGSQEVNKFPPKKCHKILNQIIWVYAE